jgi:hypothetical protein
VSSRHHEHPGELRARGNALRLLLLWPSTYMPPPHCCSCPSPTPHPTPLSKRCTLTHVLWILRTHTTTTRLFVPTCLRLPVQDAQPRLVYQRTLQSSHPQRHTSRSSLTVHTHRVFGLVALVTQSHSTHKTNGVGARVPTTDAAGQNHGGRPEGGRLGPDQRVRCHTPRALALVQSPAHTPAPLP